MALPHTGKGTCWFRPTQMPPILVLAVIRYRAGIYYVTDKSTEKEEAT